MKKDDGRVGGLAGIYLNVADGSCFEDDGAHVDDGHVGQINAFLQGTLVEDDIAAFVDVQEGHLIRHGIGMNGQQRFLLLQ